MNYVHGEKIVALLEQINDKADSLLHDHKCMKDEGCPCHCEEKIDGIDGVSGLQEQRNRACSERNMWMEACIKAQSERAEALSIAKKAVAELKMIKEERDSAVTKNVIASQQISCMRDECKMNRELRVRACRDRDFADGVATGLIQKENAMRDRLSGEIKRAEIYEAQFVLAAKDFVEVSNKLDAVKSNRDCLIKKCDMLQDGFERLRIRNKKLHRELCEMTLSRDFAIKKRDDAFAQVHSLHGKVHEKEKERDIAIDMIDKKCVLGSRVFHAKTHKEALDIIRDWK